jgi:hypothetical protein
MTAAEEEEAEEADVDAADAAATIRCSARLYADICR